MTPAPKTIYTYWEGFKPCYIDYCMESIRERSGIDVVVLNKTNAVDYMGSMIHPNWRKVTNIAQKVDLIRLGVIFEHGGMWCDADTLILKPLESLFEGNFSLRGFRWKHNKALLNGNFVAPKHSDFIHACINIANNSLSKEKKSYYASKSGCTFGEDIFCQVIKNHDIDEASWDVLFPVQFPSNAHCWTQPGTIFEYPLSERTLGIGLNHSHVEAIVKHASVEDIMQMDNLLGSIFRLYRYGKDAARPHWIDSQGSVHAFSTPVHPYKRPYSTIIMRPADVEVKKIEQKKDKAAPKFVHREAKLAIVVSAADDYLWYLPMFTYCAGLLPSCEVIVIAHADAKLPETTEKEARVIRTDKHIACGRSRAYRYLLGEKELKTYQYLLYTDVDILLMKEDTTYVDQHAHHMNKDGTYCYENWVQQTMTEGWPRLNGVHFVNSEWWGLTAKARAIELAELDDVVVDIPWWYDEVMLGRIVSNSNLPLPPTTPKLWRNHGVHLGVYRGRRPGKALARFTSAQESTFVAGLLKDDVFLDRAREAGEKTPMINYIIQKGWPNLFR